MARSSYFICATSRSGSTLLCERLMDTGVAGRPEEYFNVNARATIGDASWREWDSSDFGRYVNRVMERATTPNGVFGSKLVLIALERLVEALRGELGAADRSDGQVLTDRLPNLHYIWITRRNKVRQAISAYRALQTNQWVRRVDAAEPEKRPRYNFALIDEQIDSIVLDEAAWMRFFSANGIRPYTVVYEDLAEAPEQTVEGILRYLGIDSGSVDWGTSELGRQSDWRNDEWEERYLVDKQEQRKRTLVRSAPVLLRNSNLRRAYLMPALARRVKVLSRPG